MKKIFVTMLAFLAVSCSETPESVCEKFSVSAERVVLALDSDRSGRDKEEVIKEETDKMKKLVTEARAVRGTPEAYYRARFHVMNGDKSYVSRLLEKHRQGEHADLIREYNRQVGLFRSELEKSCGIDD